MIGKLKGTIDSLGQDFVIVDTGGVGYHVTCSTRTLAALPSVGEPAEVVVETLVSQDAIRLIGFASESERAWFRLLLGVQGVGLKVALAVLSTLAPGDLANAIAAGDKAMVATSPGVGPRVAQRIVTELRDKAPACAAIDPAVAASGGDDGATVPAASDAVSALVNLGYGRTQAATAVSAALFREGEGAATEALIRMALKELSR